MRLTASITKRTQPRFRASELLCLAVSLLLKVVPLLKCLAEARLPTYGASMFRRQAIECGTQDLQISRKIFIGYFGEFIVK
jgi:hypothetical protein